MEFVTVDNDEKRLEMLKKQLELLYPNCSVKSFTDPMLSAKYICNNKVDEVFAQQEMVRINGEELMYVLRKNKPFIRVKLFREVLEAVE